MVNTDEVGHVNMLKLWISVERHKFKGIKIEQLRG